MSSHLKRAVINVELSLRGTFVACAIFMTMIGKRKEYSIATAVAFAESGAEKTFFIAILASAV